MKNTDSTSFSWQNIVSAVLVILACSAGSGYCQNNEYVLLLQQTPAEGGQISPAMGVHRFAANEVIHLAAVPEPGYQFVYWLGDVSDATSSSTTIYLDAPKIVIAVFERAEFQFLPEEGRVPAGRGGGGLIRARAEYAAGGGGGAGAKRPHKPPGLLVLEVQERFPEIEEEPISDYNDFPIPEEEINEFPVPSEFPVPNEIPEPATVTLLGIGSLMILFRPKHRKKL